MAMTNERDRRRMLAVIGPRSESGGWSEELAHCAERVGEWAAAHEWAILCGGLTGAGESAVRTCRSRGGLTIAVTPEDEDDSGAEIVIRTRLGVYRNFVIAHAADAAVAVGGGMGTLQEASQIHKLGRPLAAVGVEWQFPGLMLCTGFEELTQRFLLALSSSLG
ncbi:MAG TPA: hypothetical protein DEP35_22925 [Deltaproteobacteria bacterium]|jgi:uncharacterized protein (TIGR00725 family)|nr:hypothetical protein [Deltaproteobacteria bacterium]